MLRLLPQQLQLRPLRPPGRRLEGRPIALLLLRLRSLRRRLLARARAQHSRRWRRPLRRHHLCLHPPPRLPPRPPRPGGQRQAGGGGRIQGPPSRPRHPLRPLTGPDRRPSPLPRRLGSGQRGAGPKRWRQGGRHVPALPAFVRCRRFWVTPNAPFRGQNSVVYWAIPTNMTSLDFLPRVLRLSPSPGSSNPSSMTCYVSPGARIGLSLAGCSRGNGGTGWRVTGISRC